MDQQGLPPSYFNRNLQNTESPFGSEDAQTSKQEEITQQPRLTALRRKNEATQDISQLKAIVVFGLPESVNTKVELKRRFEVYGQVVRIFPNPSKSNATIHFDNHTSAAQAKSSVATFSDLPDAEVKILWKQTAAKQKHKETTLIASDQIPEKKTAVASSAPTRREPTKYTTLDDSLIMGASLEELYQFIKLPAKSMSDKVALLDARDRIFRLKKEAQQKTTGTNRTKNLKGTCPDMCPEKERYSRCDKRRLAAYEMIETTGKEYEVDHRFAVKEYSRSSADQAEPLPHELRPLHVLEMTSTYLFSTIVDRCDSPNENLGDWFNFLWDRTRGIRKDITQQSLCELGSVDLVEKCARFHIHCTARLCELDMQDFDQKINDENLTKCLQTLKHMYHDLSLKKIFCPNEAEFRSYDVLLHLNDGDTLRDVLQLRKEIRESPLVQTALKFFHNLNSRNYVRFFKLAEKNRHYLQCCLLQRYFNQIRNTALQIMVQAYVSQKKGQVPLSWIVSVLGFENADEACNWCQTHGLNVDVGKDVVILERATFIELPERFPPIRRSFRLIESKRNGPLRQIIANGLVNTDMLANHRPQNSFDLNGFLKKEALFDEEHVDERKSNLQEETLTKPRVSKHSITDTLSAIIFNEVLVSETQSLTHVAVKETLRQVSRGKVIHFGVQRLWEECLKQVIDECAKGLYVEFRSAEIQRQREEQLLKYKRLKREEFMRKVLNETINNSVDEAVAKIAEDVINESIARRQSTLNRLTDAISTRLLQEVLQNEVSNISNIVSIEEIEKREDLVRRAASAAQKHRLRRCFKKWAKFTKRKINLREEQMIFPACPSRLALEQQVSLLASTGESRRSNKRKSLVDRSSKAKRISNLIDLHDQIWKIDQNFEQKRIDFFTLFAKLAKSKACIVPVTAWKLFVLNLNCQNASSVLQKWVGLKSHTFSEKKWSCDETRILPSGAELSISIQFDESYEATCDADAILIVFEPSRDIASILEDISEDITPESIVGTLAIVQSENCTACSVPSALNSVCDAKISVEDANPFSYFRVHQLLANVINHSFNKLLKEKPVEMTLWDFAHRFVMKNILPFIDRDLQERGMKGCHHRPLKALVHFYNERITEFLSLVESNEDNGYFTSDNPSVIELLANYMILPNCGSEFAEVKDIISYCKQIAVTELDPVSLISRILDITTKYGSSGLPVKTTWTEIFQACLDYRMQAFIHKGNEVMVRLASDFSGSLKKAFNATAAWNSYLEPETEDVEEDDHAHASPIEDFKATQQSFSQVIAVPDNIQALCEKISLASSQIDNDSDFFERSLNLPSLPPQRSPHVPHKTPASMTVEENLALLEQKIALIRRGDRQFEAFLAKASQK